jgi:hypothetical protein
MHWNLAYANIPRLVKRPRLVAMVAAVVGVGVINPEHNREALFNN